MEHFGIEKLKDYHCNIKDYEFLSKKPCNNLILLTIAGSNAYGTNIQSSDLDIRGISVNAKSSILTMRDFEVYHSSINDTEIYSLEKFLNLATKCNPNIIELLGAQPQSYIFLNDFGKLLINNKNCFLSQLCIKSFEGYITSILKHIVTTKESIDHKRTNKSIMHLIRLKTMLAEILETEEINTFRKDKDLLLNIRNGLFLTNGKLNNDFYEYETQLNKRIEYAKLNTNLKPLPNFKMIDEIHQYINLHIINETEE